jgi:hypothetical protein
MASMLGKPFDELGGAVQSGFGVGGVHVQLSGECKADVALAPTLEPFRVQLAAFDIDVSVRWVANIAQPRGRKAFDSGATWRLYEAEAGFQFDFHLSPQPPYQRLAIDEGFRSATLQMSEEYFAGLPVVPQILGYPIDELLIMHRLTQERAIELHGCGIVTADGTGNLFVGHSGAGKSTTTRLWTATEDVEILSDDRIIVREHPGHMRMYGTPWHGEAMFASPNSAPLTRIMILEHGHGNLLTRLSPSQAVAELFARSFVPMHRHEYVESALEFLQSVAESVPCYRYSFEPDPRAVEKILNLRD